MWLIYCKFYNCHFNLARLVLCEQFLLPVLADLLSLLIFLVATVICAIDQTLEPAGVEAMRIAEVLVFLSAGLLVLGPVPSAAFLEGFAQSIGMMNQQLTKFMEGLHQSVDVWANKVIDNANKEECFYLCPRGTVHNLYNALTR